MTEEFKFGELISNNQKIQTLKKLLDNLENREWMRLMQAPQYLQKKLVDLCDEKNTELIIVMLAQLIQETEELIKIAAYHRFRNSNSVQVWAILKDLHQQLCSLKISA